MVRFITHRILSALILLATFSSWQTQPPQWESLESKPPQWESLESKPPQWESIHN